MKMLKHIKEGDAGSQTTDPVCGMAVEGDTQHRYNHKGTEHLFCSEHCLTKFKSAPDDYPGATVAITL